MRKKPVERRRTRCIEDGCERLTTGARCRPCADKAQRFRPDGDPRVRRNDRERSAPGLKRRERDALLAKWRRQGRACAYCGAAGITMDHVIPLIRGGTNHEGNLVPCCRSCNSRKQHRYISEMRHGWLISGSGEIGWVIRPATPRRPKHRQFAPDEPFKMCACGAWHDRRSKYCCEECAQEANRINARNRYRARVGIPLVAPLTKTGRPRIAA